MEEKILEIGIHLTLSLPLAVAEGVRLTIKTAANGAISTNCTDDFRGRGCAKNVQRKVLAIEVIEGRTWRQVISTDLVSSFVCDLARPMIGRAVS